MTERTGLMEVIVAHRRALEVMRKTQRRWQRQGLLKRPEDVRVRKQTTLRQNITIK